MYGNTLRVVPADDEGGGSAGAFANHRAHALRSLIQLPPAEKKGRGENVPLQTPSPRRSEDLRGLDGENLSCSRSLVKRVSSRVRCASTTTRPRRSRSSPARPSRTRISCSRRRTATGSRPSRRSPTSRAASASSSSPTSAASTASTRSSRCASPSGATRRSRSTTSAAPPASRSAATTSSTCRTCRP